MATATHTFPGRAEGRRDHTFAAAVITAELRAAIERKAQELLDEARAALDGAAYLIDFLDAADRPTLDLEPDVDGEEEAGEASPQPATLSPCRRPATVIRPSRRQMAAAYRAIGAPVPRTLRGPIGRLFA